MHLTYFRAFTSRLLCAQQTFVRLYSDFCAFTQLSCIQPYFLQSCLDFHAFSSFSCVHIQTIVRSPDLFAFTRFLCIHVQTFKQSTDFCAIIYLLSCVPQTFVRLRGFCAFNNLGCDDPLLVPSISELKNLFQSNTIGEGFLRCLQNLNQQGVKWSLARRKVAFLSIFSLYLNIIKEGKI